MVTFDISVSDQRFDKKPNKKSPFYSKLTFRKKSIGIADFIHFIREGRFMCGLFTRNIFDIADKTNNNYVGTYVVPIDVDDSDTSMDDFIHTLHVKPTIAYETFSNLEDGKGYRFRLLYVFDQMIVGPDNYIMLYDAIVKCNAIAGYVDDSMRRYSQGYFGTGTNRSVIAYGCIYSASAFSSFIDFPKETHAGKNRFVNSINKKEQEYDNRVGEPVFEDKDFEKKWHCDGNVSDFLRNMGMKYFAREKSLVEHEDGVLWTGLEDTDYFAIKRQWHRTMTMGRQVSVIKRIRYGQHRKTKIFRSLMTRRLIDPTIRLEHLCWAALYELHYFVDNTDPDHKITKQDLLSIAKRAMSENLDNYRERLTARKSFEINKEECRRQGISVQKAVGMANGERRHQRAVEVYKGLAELYNPELKRNDNIKNFRDNGYEISLSKYLRFKKWYDNDYKNEKDKKNNDKIYREMKEKENYKYPELQEEDGKELLKENNEMLKELLSYVKPEKEKTREETFLEFFNKNNLVGSK